MNIVLIGMRGSGKSTIAKLLSKKLNIPVVETDTLLAKEIGMTIPEFVHEKGWEEFRNAETKITKKISEKENVIISTGGGVVLRDENIHSLKQHGTLFYLKSSSDVLYQRMGDDPNRPMLTQQTNRKDEIEQVLSERKHLYEKSADFIIETDALTEEQVVHEIFKNL